MLEDLAEPGLLRLQAGAVVGDAGLRIQDGDDNAVCHRTSVLHHIVCGEGGKGGVGHQLSQHVHVLLQEKAGGGHLPAAETIPEADLGIQKEGLPIQILQIKSF